MLTIRTAPGSGAAECWRVKHCRILFSLVICISSLGLNAAPKGSVITLSAAVQRSLAQNPSLDIFPYRYDSLEGQEVTARLRPAYEVEVDAENVGGTGELNGAESAELTVALSSVIEIGGKRTARQDVVSHNRSALDASRQVESLNLLGEVIRRYVEVLAAQGQVDLAAEAAQLANESLRIVKERAAAGATPEAEVKRAEAAAGQSQLTLLSQKQRLAYLKVALSAMWGAVTSDFDEVEGELFHFGGDVDFETLYAKVKKNPAIEIFAVQSRLKEAEIRLAQAQSRADISWSVGVRRLQEADETALVAGFSMPLFSGKRNAGAVSTAIAEKYQVMAQRDVMLLDLHTQLFRAYHNRKQAIVAVETLRTTIIPALEQALLETQKAYQRGRYGYLDYVSARQELLSAKRSQIEAAEAALTYGAEIEQLTAEPLALTQYGENYKIPGSSR